MIACHSETCVNKHIGTWRVFSTTGFHDIALTKTHKCEIRIRIIDFDHKNNSFLHMIKYQHAWARVCHRRPYYSTH